MAGKQIPSRSISLENGAVSLSVREAARILGVSTCSVYGYLARGKLAKHCVDERIMLREDEVLAFARRTRAMQSGQYPSHMLTMLVPVRPGCSKRLNAKLEEFYRQNKHIIPGTSRQLLGRSENDPERVVIVLFWPGESLPPIEQRQQALAALTADLEEVCEWETALIFEGATLAHAG